MVLMTIRSAANIRFLHKEVGTSPIVLIETSRSYLSLTSERVSQTVEADRQAMQAMQLMALHQMRQTSAWMLPWSSHMPQIGRASH